MQTKVDICNLALVRLGAKRINSLDENTPSAKNCSLFFDQIADIVLREHSWSFATKNQSLGLIADESVIGWDYLYKFPADCLAPRRIYNAETVGLTERQEFKAMQSPATGSVVIAAKISPCYLEYTAKIADVAMYDSSFVDALAWRLAAELAHPLMGNADAGMKFLQIYERVLINAKATNAQTREEKPRESCSYSDAR